MDAPSILLPSERAYSFSVHLRAIPDQQLWLGGELVYDGGYEAGSVSLVDLMDAPTARLGGPFDLIDVYVPAASIDAVAAEHGCVVKKLAWPWGRPDPVAASFAALLLRVLDGDQADALFAEHVLLAFRIHVAQTYGGMRVARPGPPGGLSVWQERRAKEMMRARFATAMSIADLARECGLSPSHFTRAFRASTGMPPHQWVRALRIEAASLMLAEGRLPLTEIALACGFGDQSYFTRVFRRTKGMPPRAWLRVAGRDGAAVAEPANPPPRGE